MSAAYSVFTTYRTLTCYKCGIHFGVPDYFDTKRREDKQEFFCPNGHGQGFYGDNEKEKLQKELENEKKRRLWAEENTQIVREQRDRQERKVRAYKGIITKTKKRVANGICPCCNRTFQNLMNHMKTEHPSYRGRPRQSSKKA